MEQEFGRIVRQADGYQVTFERLLRHDIHKVWAAISDPAKMSVWFTDITFAPQPGAPITFKFRDEARSESFGEVLRLDPPHVFEFLWEGEHGRWELETVGEGETRLRLIYSRFGKEFLSGAPSGFHILLDRLALVLDGHTTPWDFASTDDIAQGQPMRDRYAARVAPLLRVEDDPKGLGEDFVLERHLKADPRKVWAAITDPIQIRAWGFPIADFRAELGFVFEFEGGPDEGPRYHHTCTITELLPGQRLAYTWKYATHPATTLVRWELFPEDGGTRLVLTHSGLDQFAASDPNLARENFAAGWTEIVGEILRGQVED